MFREDGGVAVKNPWEEKPDFKVDVLPGDNFEITITKGNQNLVSIAMKALRFINASVNNENIKDLISGQVVRSGEDGYYKGRLVFKDDDVNSGAVLKIIIEQKKNQPIGKSESVKKDQQNIGRAVLQKSVLKK